MMKNLFDLDKDKNLEIQPLSERLRPNNIDEFFGQDHIFKRNSFFSKMIETNNIYSIILWGPPGSGKTTLARIICNSNDFEFHKISAVHSGVVEIKKIIESAIIKLSNRVRSVLFIDEIHRLNRSQQDSLLGAIEEGVLILIGATTENPSFVLNKALISRCNILPLNNIARKGLEKIYYRAQKFLSTSNLLSEEAKDALFSLVDGDARFLLNIIEMIHANGSYELDRNSLMDLISSRPLKYDKSGEEHYNLISALHKSIRGSDVDASLYWLSRMLIGGEDPLYIFRRLLRIASEDVGLANPSALTYIVSAKQAYESVGLPEGEIFLSQSVIFLSTTDKSNAVYLAQKLAAESAKKYGSLSPPKHIINAPNKFMKELGYSEGYIYDHSLESNYSGQNYFPENFERRVFYEPKGLGFEKKIKDRLLKFKNFRKKD